MYNTCIINNMPSIEWAPMMSSVVLVPLSSYSRQVRKILVDNHEDDYEVEVGNTVSDELSITAVCCVPVTVQVAMLLNMPFVPNHLQSFDQVGICLIKCL